MKTYKEILNSKSTQQIRLITIHNILNDIDMNLLIEKAKQIFIKQNIQISDEQLSEYINYCAQQWLNAIRRGRCGHILGLFYAVNPRLCLYSAGLI